MVTFVMQSLGCDVAAINTVDFSKSCMILFSDLFSMHGALPLSHCHQIVWPQEIPIAFISSRMCLDHFLLASLKTDYLNPILPNEHLN